MSEIKSYSETRLKGYGYSNKIPTYQGFKKTFDDVLGN